MAIVIQTLSRSNSVIASKILQTTSAKIGRGFTCDFHVDDPYVCEQHLDIHVNERNEIELVDNQSVNGLKVNDKQTSTAIVSAEDILVIGQSRFKVFASSTAIAPTKKLHPLDEYLEQIAKKRLLVLFVAVYLVFSLFDFYVNSFVEIDFGSLLRSVLSGFLVIFSLPLSFSLLSMITKKEPRFVTQLNITLIGFITFSLIGYVVSFVGFNFNQPSILGLLENILEWIFLLSGFWLLMYVAFHHSNTKRNTIVLSVAAVIASLLYLPGLLDENDFIGPPQINAEIASPSLLFTSSTDTNDFISNASSLFESASVKTDKDEEESE